MTIYLDRIRATTAALQGARLEATAGRGRSPIAIYERKIPLPVIEQLVDEVEQQVHVYQPNLIGALKELAHEITRVYGYSWPCRRTVIRCSTYVPPSPTFQNLPADVHRHIFSFLLPTAQMTLALTYKGFYRLFPITPYLVQNFYKVAAAFGQERLFFWGMQRRLRSDIEVGYWAGYGGNPQIVSWGFQCNKWVWGTDVCVGAAAGGQLELLQGLYDEFFPPDTLLWVDHRNFRHREVDQAAARSGHLPVLQWLKQKKGKIADVALTEAVRHNRLKVLQWLNKECKHYFIQQVSHEAAQNGHLALLQWALQEGCPWNPSFICAKAAKSGNVAMLKWLLQQGASWTEEVCTNAAISGHLAILEYAHANNLPWSPTICTDAAIYVAQTGDFTILDWLQTHGSAGLPWKCVARVLRSQHDQFASSPEEPRLWTPPLPPLPVDPLVELVRRARELGTDEEFNAVINEYQEYHHLIDKLRQYKQSSENSNPSTRDFGPELNRK